MINAEYIFNELGPAAALWCGAKSENVDLARVAEDAVRRGVSCMSAAPDDIGALWIWLEKSPVKIYGRFYLGNGMGADLGVVSDLALRINSSFKRGGAGAQIFVRRADLTAFADQMHVVRDDLFFNKDLSVGIDLADVDAHQWGGIFDALIKMRASSLVLSLAQDIGKKSDFVGRVYGALNAWNPAFSGNLHFVAGAGYMRAEQVWRLVQKMRPNLAAGAKIFIN